MKELALVSQEREKKTEGNIVVFKYRNYFYRKLVFISHGKKRNNRLTLQQRLFTSDFKRLL